MRRPSELTINCPTHFVQVNSMRIHFQIQEGVLAGYQMTNDYKGSNFTASLTAVNNDIVQNTGEYYFQFN